MDLNEILATTLRRGCGVELEELVRTEEFMERAAARAALFEELSVQESDLGVAFRAGHIEMGALLNVLPEELAIQQAEDGNQPDPHLSVLLEVVGEELLKAASKCLPLEVKSSAVLYPGSNGDAQLRLINAAYEWLSNSHAKSKELKDAVESTDRLDDDTVLFQLKMHGSEEKILITKRIARRVVDYYVHLGRKRDAKRVADLLVYVLKRRKDEDKGELDPVGANLIIDFFFKNAAELAQEAWVRQFTQDQYTSDMVLPKEYGKLGVASSVPCCLGMSLMLCAFARLTGLPVMLVNPLSSSLDHEYAVSRRYGQAIVDHLEEIEDPNLTYRETMQRQVDTANGVAGRVQDFHYSIAMKVADGRWVQLDPYLNTWGAYGDAWELDRIYALLTKYKVVLPGLTLVGDDGGETARWEQEWLDRFDRAIAAAEHTLLAIDEVPFSIQPDQEADFWDPVLDDVILDYDFVWLYQVVATAADLFDLALEMYTRQGRKTDGEFYLFVEQAGLGEVTSMIFDRRRESSPEEIDLIIDGFVECFNDDTSFRLRTIKKLVGRFISWVVGTWDAEVSRPSRRVLDPTMQFSLPEYNLGLAVTSHVRSWTFPEVPGRLLVDLSSSQILWHDAVDLSQGDDQSDMDHPDVMRAEAMVKALPQQHAACVHKLHYIAGLRQEGKTDAEEARCCESGRGNPEALQ